MFGVLEQECNPGTWDPGDSTPKHQVCDAIGGYPNGSGAKHGQNGGD
jgi:hypothetical protein